jgi:16S rRNA (uracil1498-N3)-methyltransferase
VLAESKEEQMLKNVIESRAEISAPHNSVALAVGPEGGWTDDELKSFESAGWITASLGPTILRAETAVIAATAITAAVSD